MIHTYTFSMKLYLDYTVRVKKFSGNFNYSNMQNDWIPFRSGEIQECVRTSKWNKCLFFSLYAWKFKIHTSTCQMEDVEWVLSAEKILICMQFNRIYFMAIIIIATWQTRMLWTIRAMVYGSSNQILHSGYIFIPCLHKQQ